MYRSEFFFFFFLHIYCFFSGNLDAFLFHHFKNIILQKKKKKEKKKKERKKEKKKEEKSSRISIKIFRLNSLLKIISVFNCTFLIIPKKIFKWFACLFKHFLQIMHCMIFTALQGFYLQRKALKRTIFSFGF